MLLYIWIDRFSRAGDPNFIRDMRTFFLSMRPSMKKRTCR
jgi:hypothetical protein